MGDLTSTLRGPLALWRFRNAETPGTEVACVVSEPTPGTFELRMSCNGVLLQQRGCGGRTRALADVFRAAWSVEVTLRRSGWRDVEED